MVKISNARMDMEGARVDNAIFKDYGETLIGGATGTPSGAAFTCDISAGNAFYIILNSATVDIAFVNVGPSGSACSIMLMLQQDSTGNRLVSWPNTVLWDGGATPALTKTPGRLDIFSFMSPDGGRKWFGFSSQQNLTGLNVSQATWWEWGARAGSALNDAAPRMIPAPVGTDTWNSITRSLQDGFGVKPDGTLWAWGSNHGGYNGELGDNSITDRSSPIQIGTLTNWASVNTGSYNTHAIKTDGTLWGWGGASSSVRGTVGDNSVTQRSSPVQIGTLTNWATLGLATISPAALDTSGHLFMWGINSGGQLGDNSILTRSSPVQIGTLTNWLSIVSQRTTLATKTDGTLWAWGLNNLGQVGDLTTTSRSSPVQIGTLTNWACVAEAYVSSAAIRTDGTLWTWGDNSKGGLGINSIIASHSPTQVGTLTNWATVAGGQYNMLATKTDGTLWAWGLNSTGQLGTGDRTNRSSPVQIGQANTWTLVCAASTTSLALKT